MSYLVFTIISYHLEIKRKNIDHERHFGYFSLYLLFFPRIAQGPIERPQKLMPQLREFHSFDYGLVTKGLKLILWGYFKKLVIADRLAIYVNAVYNNSAQHNGTTFMLATVFFAFQIYADFSGYTDIALGSAQLFGIRLTSNFNRPYLSTSIKEFWNRWHITFSTWLRDYLFLPIAFYFSKRMKKDRYLYIPTEKWIYLFSIMITFVICGVWHGEGWTYLVWGFLFGIYLSYSNWTDKLQKKIRKRFHIKKTSGFYITYKILVTFILVSFTWVFFRANTLTDALLILKRILSFKGPLFLDRTTIIYGIVGITVLILVEIMQEFGHRSTGLFKAAGWKMEYLAYITVLFLILTLGVFDGGQFIYFQF
ncbi:MAG: MBOAT family O-acyltransferase [Bacteroidota bacterium]